MVLLSNVRRTIVGLEGYGLNIVAQKAIPNIVAEGYTG
jgi:GTP cyclohydrolase II